MKGEALSDEIDLADLYSKRFTRAELEFKRRMWVVLVERFFQRFVNDGDTVLDLGAGACEFLNEVACSRKIAVDLNPETAKHARNAEVYPVRGSSMDPVATGSVDVLFCSNFFEHLSDKTEVLRTLRECHRVLRPGGRLLVLQPNLRYLPGSYWDYLDHNVPLTDRSMVEALSLTGFVPEEVLPRFLPYTVKGYRVPKSASLVRLYLRMRFAWPIFGKQMFISARSEE